MPQAAEPPAPPVLPPSITNVIAEAEAYLRDAVVAAELPPNLREAVQYALLGGGKRLRPVLVLLSSDAAGGNRADAHPAAAAIELIHAFSLVHDDLPAMDDDDLRRGRPTLHVHAGEAMAILAGDVMVSLAFELIANAQVGADQRIELVRELSLGTTRMIAGQVFDTLGGLPAQMTDRQRLAQIHRHKTGALIRASCRMGAVCAGASPDVLDILTRYGEAIGLMFQVIDDILDVTQPTEHLGKASGKDQDAGKLTFPGLLGLEGSRREVERLHAEAAAAIAPLGRNAEPLRCLADYMAVRTR